MGSEAVMADTGRRKAHHQPGRHCVRAHKWAHPSCSPGSCGQAVCLGHHEYLYAGAAGVFPMHCLVCRWRYYGICRYDMLGYNLDFKIQLGGIIIYMCLHSLSSL